MTSTLTMTCTPLSFSICVSASSETQPSSGIAAAEARAVCLQVLGAAHWRTAAATSVEGAALLGLGQTAQGAKLLVDGLAALRADDGALTFYVDNAARWLAEYNRKRSNIVLSRRVLLEEEREQKRFSGAAAARPAQRTHVQPRRAPRP